MKEAMRQSETAPACRITPFEAELVTMLADRQVTNKTTAIRRAIVRGAYPVLGAMKIAKLREKHGLTYREMLEILGTSPADSLPLPYPSREDELEAEDAAIDRETP